MYDTTWRTVLTTLSWLIKMYFLNIQVTKESGFDEGNVGEEERINNENRNKGGNR